MLKYSGRYLTAKETFDLTNWLGTRALENVSRLSKSTILFGQPNPSRVSRRRTPPDWELHTGLYDWSLPEEKRFIAPGVSTVLEGKLEVLIGNTVYQARQGDWLIFPDTLPHMEYCLPSRASYRLLGFRPFLGQPVLSDCCFSAKEDFTIHLYKTLLRPTLAIQKEVGALLANPDQPLETVRLTLVRLIVWWLDILGNAARETVVHSHPLMDRIQALLSQPGSEAFSVGDLAERVGISLSHLSRLFHQATGQTIREVLQSKRIERARQYLIESPLTIKEIAYQLGFANPQHFAHAFRRLVGVSPGAFRQNAKGSR